jgi:3,4-dihydroxy 2-butanone 4-phosphate synthase/GTP cyclohydrolase II
MFTGIIEELGDVVAVEELAGAARICIRGPQVTVGAACGDSIAVNGVCLTVLEVTGTTFTAHVTAETLNRTGLGALVPGSPVNLERARRLDGRLGGHLVQGHVDAVGTIVSRRPAKNWDVVRVAVPPGLVGYVVERGSVAVDGVSLTVSAIGGGSDIEAAWFEVSLIPATLALTTLGRNQPGSGVNLEVDVVGKYVERLLHGQVADRRAGGSIGASAGSLRRPAGEGAAGVGIVSATNDAIGSSFIANGTRPVDSAELAAATDGTPLDSVERAIAEIAAGRPVVVVDNADRENEGDIVMAASKMTPELMAFMIRHTSGVICVPLTGAILDRLQLPLMTPHNTECMQTAFTVSVDARYGGTSGISAADRARTVRVLADSASEPYELVRPGHVFPLRYTEGGVLRRPGHTESAVDLARLAGLAPAGVVGEVVNEDGSMARLPALRAFADLHGLLLISIAQLVEYRLHSELTVTRAVETRLPNSYGDWRALGYLNSVDSTEHVALVLGDVGDGEEILVRVHSECLTGDVLGSRRCDCGAQLDASMAAIAAEGRGIVIYLRGHEGRGIGLLSKLRAYHLQDGGMDTVEANLELGLPADAREYSTGAQILADLGARSIRLLTNNPAKVRGLSGFGVKVAARVPLPVALTRENLRYLITKRDRLGHQIDGLPALDGLLDLGETITSVDSR